MSTSRHLILDAGNTQLKLAYFEQGELIRVNRVPNAQVTDGLSEARAWQPQAVIFASVSDLRIDDILGIFPSPLFHFTSQTDTPVQLDYATTSTLGTDRIANACGALKICGDKNVLVIDIGTCVTYDLLEVGKRFVGGAISPGMRLRNQSMHDFTARLPLVELVADPPLTGKSTHASLQAGIFHGLLDEMEGRIARYRQSYPDLDVVITGGDSVYFEKAFKSSIFAHLNLTLLGLHEILLHQLDKSQSSA